jgi:hypothetical protein
LTQLTLVGALLTTAVAAGLLVPGVFGNDQVTGDQTTTDLGSDAPTPNDDFNPSVATANGGEEHEEHEEYDDEDDEHDEYEDEEHEAYERLEPSDQSGRDVAQNGGN